MAQTTDPDQLLSRRSKVEPFHAMDILAEANRLSQAGRDVCYLCVGQPSATAPKAALDQVANHLKNRPIGYTDAGGRADLKQRIAGLYKQTYGVNVDAEQVFVTTGSSAGFNLAFLALFNPGDRVAIAAPGYPAYRNILNALSLEVVEIETNEENRWSVAPQDLRDAHNRAPLAGILIASPANPTGTMMTPEALGALIDCANELGVRFISDEIYHGLIYPEETGIGQATALEFSGNSVVINSFSKYYCMTGWRIGWMILPKAMVRAVERLAQSLYISPPELSQIGALHALEYRDELETVREGYLANRNLLLTQLPTIGFDRIMPIDGAFYAYVDASAHSDDTMTFAKTILAETGVALTPGVDFDPVRGHQYLRISFAGAQSQIKEALERLEDWL